MNDEKQLDALRAEYLLLSKEIFRQMENGAGPTEMTALRQTLNALLERIKLLEGQNPSDLVKD